MEGLLNDIFAPPGGWRVRILDLSGGAQDNVVEEIGGFTTLMQANAFARRYVRDSVERCRTPGMRPKDVLDAWFAYGEDAEVVNAGEDAWRSANELGDFADQPASAEQRDWRSIDPRREGGDDDPRREGGDNDPRREGGDDDETMSSGAE